MSSPGLLPVVAFLFALGELTSTAAHACSCLSVPLTSAVEHTPVIVVGTAGASTLADGANTSAVIVEEGLKGPKKGERLSVQWRAPDGKSCDMVTLTPGRWLLFLTPGPDGVHHIGRCDQHSHRLRDKGRARIDAVKKELRVTSPTAAAARAVAAVNAALARAWDAAPAEQRDLGGPHTDPWVAADRATVTGDAATGFVVRFSSFPPAGFSHQAEARVSKEGAVVVVSATAAFSPD